MRRKKQIIGENFIPQIKKKTQGLQSALASHGNVFQGELADQALNAVGARAMTMDGEIIVNSNFNLSSAEDQALYAHEMYHKKHSGGKAGSSVRDAEEIAARAVEAMVFHNAEGGHADALPTNMDDLFSASDRAIAPAENKGAIDSDNKKKSEGTSAKPSALEGYKALRKQGLTHAEVVAYMAQMLLEHHDTMKQEEVDRGGLFRGFSQ